MEALREGAVVMAVDERRQRFLAQVDRLEAIMLRLEAAERMWAVAGLLEGKEGAR